MASDISADIDIPSLEQKIAEQSAIYNDLKQSGSDPTAMDKAHKALGELKKALGKAKSAAGGGKAKDKEKEKEAAKDRILLKTAKGTKDFGPSEMTCRSHILRIVESTFLLYGGSCLDTPVFERKDVLTGKYGEDQKLIYDLQDQGGEQLALRYDHTVPLARYLAMQGGQTQGNGKIWQIGKVYRRDQPVMSKGRMREFMQADFDVAGVWDPMIPDSEIISLVCTILNKLDIKDFTIKINHRKILDGIFEVCGVPADKIRTISSAVDKLDKMPWSDVKKEMTEEKGLKPDVADKIGEYVKHKGREALLDTLFADATLTANKRAKEGLDDMKILFTLLTAHGVMDRISFDLSLARGLDYYTGIIYEAVTEASAPPSLPQPTTSAPAEKKKDKKPSKGEDEEVDESTVGVGSIAAGGRYDGLVGMFLSSSSDSKKDKKAPEIPCIGISFGIDRIFSLIYPTWITQRAMRSNNVMVYVMSAGGDGHLSDRVALVSELRAGGINADYLGKTKPKLPQQFAAGERVEAPFAVIVGGDELKEGLVTVKEQRWELVGVEGQVEKKKIDNEDKGVKVRRDELVIWLKETQVWKEWEGGKFW